MARRLTAALPLFLAATAAHGDVGGEADACARGHPAVLVKVVGLKDHVGRLKLELYPANSADFLRDDRDLLAAGKIFRRVWASIPPSGTTSLCIRIPKPGTYALLLTHDRDGKNKFNPWRDGAGVPGNAPMGRSRPEVAGAEVKVGNGPAVVTIQVQYLHGFPPSFSPLSK